MNKISTTIDKYKNETAYVTRSGTKKPEKRGRKMEVVDLAFDNYVLAFGNNDATDLKLTSNLYVACKEWLQKNRESLP